VHLRSPAGKGGWTAERKYELDSGAYFINLLHNYMHTPGTYDPERLMMEPVLHDAVLLMLKVRLQESVEVAY
jgi:meiotically up-regulated gene 157 (Mug157) protein